MNGYPIEQPEYDDGECPQCGDPSLGGDFCSPMCMHRYYENLKPIFVHPQRLTALNSMLRDAEKTEYEQKYEGVEIDISMEKTRDQETNMGWIDRESKKLRRSFERMRG